MADPSYTLEIQQSLTIKPKKFFIRATPRQGRTASTMLSSIPRPLIDKTQSSAAPSFGASSTVDEKEKVRQRVHVLYGSNTGTSESFAQRLATDAVGHGTRSQFLKSAVWIVIFHLNM